MEHQRECSALLQMEASHNISLLTWASTVVQLIQETVQDTYVQVLEEAAEAPVGLLNEAEPAQASLVVYSCHRPLPLAWATTQVLAS